MQTLTQESITQLTTLAVTAASVGVDTLIISPGLARGIDEKKTVGIVSTTGVPDLDGKNLALNRVKQFLTRLNLVSNKSPATIEATIASNGTDLSSFEMSNGKVKTQFRLASIEAVKGVPKGFNDVPVWKVKLSQANIQAIASAESAMGGDGFVLSSKDGTSVIAEFSDSGKDTLVIDLEIIPECLDGSSTSFSVKYWSKPVIALLKEAVKNGDAELKIGAGGLTQIIINEILFFTLPQN